MSASNSFIKSLQREEKSFFIFVKNLQRDLLKYNFFRDDYRSWLICNNIIVYMFI